MYRRPPASASSNITAPLIDCRSGLPISHEVLLGCTCRALMAISSQCAVPQLAFLQLFSRCRPCRSLRELRVAAARAGARRTRSPAYRSLWHDCLFDARLRARRKLQDELPRERVSIARSPSPPRLTTASSYDEQNLVLPAVFRRRCPWISTMCLLRTRFCGARLVCLEAPYHFSSLSVDLSHTFKGAWLR